MDITVLDSGFVTGDFMKPIGYSGEMNSRQLHVIHPHFTDCYYQLLVKKGDGLYKLGIDEDGNANIPPSLLRTATKLECQFIAMSTPCSVTNAETDTFVFKSSPFHVTVAQGLDTAGISPVPTYEELQDMYCNINAARAEVEKAKKDNNAILEAIKEALASARRAPTIDIQAQVKATFKEQLENLSSVYFDDLVERITNEALDRITSSIEIPSTPECDCGEVGKLSTAELNNLIKTTLNDMLSEIKTGNAPWYTKPGDNYTMNSDGNVVGGR